MSTSDEPGSGGQWSAAFGGGSLDGMTAYEESLVRPMFTPWAEFLLDRVHPSPGERLLDVATGPGTVARLAAMRVGPAGAVVAVDLSEAMLMIARRKPPPVGAAHIEYRQSPAAPLDVPSSAFDRLAEAIRDVLGEGAADRYRAGPWGLGDPRALEALVSGAGFPDVRIEEVRRWARFVGGAPQLERSLAASTAMSDITSFAADTRLALTAAIASRLESLTEPDGAVCSDLTSQIALAVA
jgi:SAM-dependent methyltransferase